MKKAHLYTLDGEPCAVTYEIKEPSMWGNNKQAAFHRKQQLVNQHKNRPLFTKPIRMDLAFYFMVPPKKGCDSAIYDLPYPTFEKLITFIRSISINTILTKDTPIIEISARKFYDEYPRTEILIYWEENGSKKKPKEKTI